MRTTPRDVHEFMLVSAAKACRFEPATVDGLPVRFRHSVAITSSEYMALLASVNPSAAKMRRFLDKRRVGVSAPDRHMTTVRHLPRGSNRAAPYFQ